MILETFSQDGEWRACQMDYVMVTKQGVTLAGFTGEMGIELKPDDYVLIQVLTDTRQPLRVIVDTRRPTRKPRVGSRADQRKVARTIRNSLPNTQSRYISPPEEG